MSKAVMCIADVHNKYSVTFHRCMFKAVKDGYCMKHHPDSVKKRQEQSEERYKKQRENSPFIKLENADKRISELKRELTAARAEIERLRSLLVEAKDDNWITLSTMADAEDSRMFCDFMQRLNAAISRQEGRE